MRFASVTCKAHPAVKENRDVRAPIRMVWSFGKYLKSCT
jgi:hypothetical protein